MKCKKHGDIGSHTIRLQYDVFPFVLDKNGREVDLPSYGIGKTFCLQCLMDFLEEKIGTVKE